MKFDEATPDSKAARLGFAADVSSAALAPIAQPTVALVPILLWWFPIFTASQKVGLPDKNLWRFAAAIAELFFLCGWAGAERIFFLRHFTGKPVTLRQLFGLVKPFMGRFLSLGLLVGLAFIPWWGLLAVIFGGYRNAHTTKFRVGTMSFFVAIDFALTFVPAALAFTTRSVRRALRIGFAMIRKSWPRCALYVLCPPLALNMNNLVYPGNLPMLRLIVVGVLAVVALLAKGATVAFYLRERSVYGDDGAAHIGVMDEPTVG